MDAASGVASKNNVENVCSDKIDQKEHSLSCAPSWDKLFQLWSSTDSLVQDIISHAKEDPQNEHLKAGNSQENVKKIRSDLETLKMADCRNKECQKHSSIFMREI